MTVFKRMRSAGLSAAALVFGVSAGPALAVTISLSDPDASETTSDGIQVTLDATSVDRDIGDGETLDLTMPAHFAGHRSETETLDLWREITLRACRQNSSPDWLGVSHAARLCSGGVMRWRGI